MDDYISRREHEEFSRRVEDEEHRQNKRLDLLEENVRQIGALAVSVEKLANNMESMTKEISRQGEQIKSIEQEPAELWKNAKRKSIETIIGVVIGALAIGLLMIAAMYVR